MQGIAIPKGQDVDGIGREASKKYENHMLGRPVDVVVQKALNKTTHIYAYYIHTCNVVKKKLS